jgi:hypothetical protein
MQQKNKPSSDVPVGAPFGQGQKVPEGTTRLGPRAFQLAGGEILDQARYHQVTHRRHQD